MRLSGYFVGPNLALVWPSEQFEFEIPAIDTVYQQ